MPCETRPSAPRFDERSNRPCTPVVETVVGDDPDPDVRRLVRAAMFLGACLLLVALAALIGVYH
jgi:hypothetical protein